MIYLATPYASPDPAVMAHRYNVVNRIACDLMAKGERVFSPITHNHPLALTGSLPRGWDFWKKHDLPMLALCSKLVVVALPGWTDSIGVTAEIAFAKEKGIPLEVLTPPPMPEPFRDPVARLTASIYAILYLHETGNLSEGQAAKLMNCDRLTYRLRREEMEAEMMAILKPDMDRMLEDFTDKIRERVSALPAEDRARLVDVAIDAAQGARHREACTVEYLMLAKLPPWVEPAQGEMLPAAYRTAIFANLPPGFEIRWQSRENWPVDKDGMTWVLVYCTNQRKALEYFNSELGRAKRLICDLKTQIEKA